MSDRPDELVAALPKEVMKRSVSGQSNNGSGFESQKALLLIMTMENQWMLRN